MSGKSYNTLDDYNSDELSFYEQLRAEVLVRKRACLNCGLSDSTVSGHVQSRMHLKHVGDHVNLLYSSTGNMLKYKSRKRYHFSKLVGVSSQIKLGEHGMQAFCKECDNDIFSYIEDASKQLVIGDYRQNLLFSYKALVHEYIKQDNWLIFYNRVKDDVNYRHLYSDFMRQKELRFKNITMPDMKLKMNEIEKELSLFHCLREKNFSFVTIKIPKVGFFVNGYFQVFNRVLFPDGFSDVYVSVIPDSNYNLMILGGRSGDIDKLFNLDNPLKLLSNICIKHVETWGCSADFFQRFIKPRKNKILDSIEFFMPVENKVTYKSPVINIFEDVERIHITIVKG